MEQVEQAEHFNAVDNRLKLSVPIFNGNNLVNICGKSSENYDF